MPGHADKTHQGEDGTETGVSRKGQQVKVGWRSRWREEPGYRQKVMRSVWLCFSTFCMGMQAAQTGPAFLDLQIITNTNVQQASAFLSADAAGGMIGAMLSGPVYDLVSKSLLLIFSVLLLSVAIAVKPFCASFWLMVGVSFGSSLFRGSLGTVGTADMVRTWGEGEGQSAMHTLHFSFAFGALMSPLLTEPFLAPSVLSFNRTRNGTDEGALQLYLHHSTATNISSISSSVVNVSRANASESDASADFYLPQTRIHIAFLIVASLMFLSAVCLALEYIQKAKRRGGKQPQAEAIGSLKEYQDQPENSSALNSLRSRVCDDFVGNNEDDMFEMKLTTPPARRDIDEPIDDARKGRVELPRCRPDLPLLPYVAALSSMCLFYVLQVGAEVTFTSYLSNYVVVQMDWTKSQGAMVTFVFWIFFTATRLTSIFLSRALTSLQLLLACLSLAAAALLAFLLGSLWRLDWIVWVCSGAVGASMSPIFPTSMMWLKEELLPVTGRVTSAFMVAGGCGILVNPLILGHLMEQEGAIWMSYLLLGETTLAMMIFLVVSMTSRFYLQRRFPPTWRTTEIIITGDVQAGHPSQPFLNNET